jgi:hypothetical protein
MLDQKKMIPQPIKTPNMATSESASLLLWHPKTQNHVKRISAAIPQSKLFAKRKSDGASLPRDRNSINNPLIRNIKIIPVIETIYLLKKSIHRGAGILKSRCTVRLLISPEKISSE